MVTIVPAQPQDAAQLSTWGKSAWQLWASERTKFYGEKEMKNWIEHPREDILLVAKEDERLIGMSLTYVFLDWAYCSALFVDEQFRGKKIGSMLINTTLEKLKEKNIRLLGMYVDVKNEEGKSFYKKIGFEEGFQFYWMEKRF